MAETKYGKQITRASIKKDEHSSEPIFMFNAADFGVDAGWVLVPVTEPFLMADKPHKHDFHQFLCFLGSNPKNMDDLGGEIEISLGEEGEKHIITEPSIVHISPNLTHAPLNYKRVDRPIYHLDIFFGAKYVRKY